MGHFDGSVPCPVLNPPTQTSSTTTTPTPDPDSTTPAPAPSPAPVPAPTVTQDMVDAWMRNESIARSLLAQRLHDSTFVVVSVHPSVKAMWDAIVRGYTYKSVFAQARLRREFQTARCPERGDIRTFLNELCAKKAELAAVGVTISDDDYRNAIIQALPRWLATFASNQLTASRLANREVEPELLITFICDEWERTRPTGKGNSRHDTGDDALAFEAGGKGKGGDKGKGKKKGPCWTCGGDHWKRDCPKKEKKDGQGGGSTSWKSKPGMSANVVEEEDDCSFLVEELSDAETDASWSEVESGSVDSWVEGEFARESDDWSDFEELAAEEIVNVVEPTPTRVEVFDSGASAHISPYRDDFSTFQSTPPKVLRAANKQGFSAIGKGELVLDLPNGATSSKLHLTEVLYSPEAGYTLVSIGRLDDAGFSTTFANGKCTIRDPGGTRVAEIPRNERGLYKMIREGEEANAVSEPLTLDMLHRRLGHIAPAAAQKLVRDGLVSGLKLEGDGGVDFLCESCAYGKMTRRPIAKVREGEGAKEFGEEVHSDVWGPARVETKKGRRYYVTFIDDHSRWTHINFLTHKSDVFQAYKDFDAMCETQFNTRVKTLHSDRGGEYLSTEFQSYLKSRGTLSKLTTHDTPQHNGIAERRNRTILERTRALFHASRLPKSLWAHAVSHVVWLMNRTSSKAIEGKTSFELVYGKKPDLRGLREWGDEVWVHQAGGDKLGGRAKKGRWIGYDGESNGSRIYYPDTGTVKVERNFRFINNGRSGLEGEHSPISELQNDDPIPPPTVTIPSDPPPLEISTSPSTSEPAPVVVPDPHDPDTVDNDPVADLPEELARRPQRVRNPSLKAREILEGKAVGLAEELDWAEVHVLAAEIEEAEGLEPGSLKEAMGRADWELWKKAMEEELTMLGDTGTWGLVDPPSGVNIVGSKWVFKAKKDAAGNVVRYKARLVAQGFSQVPGVDYFDTFAPVAKLASIRAVLAIAAARNMEIHQIDIKGAFLNGKLTDDERIYMRQPPGFIDSSFPRRVCHLKKTLYGLKQSGRRWYQRLCEILVDNLAFTRCDVDHSVFFKTSGHDLIIILVHVDDCTIAATALKLISWVKEGVKEFVEITDLGEIHWLLGIELKRDRQSGKIMLSQRSYIDASLRRFGLEDTKPVSTPMDPATRLTTDHSPKSTLEIARMSKVPYQEAVGTLMYASLGTRPDITYAVQVLSKFSKNPGDAHWEAVKRVFRYLKGTRELWLTYGGLGEDLAGYTDADGNMAEDRCATSGYAFIVNGGAVSWSAKRQEIVTLSTTESEYVGATHATKEAIWLRSLISQIFESTLPTTTIFSDNKSAIALAKDHQYHARTKHIDVRYHFIRWVIEEGKIRLIYCPTEDMVADVFTKALPSPKVKHFARELGLATI